MAHKEIREIIKQVERNGFTVIRGGKHYKVKDAEGHTVYSLPGTPGGPRWKRNLLADLRRRGIIQ